MNDIKINDNAIRCIDFAEWLGKNDWTFDIRFKERNKYSRYNFSTSEIDVKTTIELFNEYEAQPLKIPS